MSFGAFFLIFVGLTFAMLLGVPGSFKLFGLGCLVCGLILLSAVATATSGASFFALFGSLGLIAYGLRYMLG